MARESKKRSGNVRYSALLCSACGFRSARKSVYSLTQQQSQEPELYKRGRTEKSSGDSVDHFPPAYITARRVSAVPAQSDAGSPIEISQPTTPPGPRSEPSKPRLLPSGLAPAIPSPPTARRPPFAPNDSSYIGKAATKKGSMSRPEPFKSHMCTECEDSARREIVLDTDRGGAYYSILRQARKRLSESRGGDPAGGNLENRILDRRNHFLLLISQ